MSDNLVLIDGSGFIWRAFHGLPAFTRSRDGLPVGAVLGFCNMLHKVISGIQAKGTATHLAVIFDHPGRTFRNDIFPAYKANRPPVPEELASQFSLVREATRAFGVPSIEMQGYEADDLIATYARMGAEAGLKVTIVSSDKDLMQLVTPGVSMYDPMKSKLIRRAEVMEKFGVFPERVIDVQALAGDPTDNVPGVPGIGVKIGAELVNRFGSLDAVLAGASEVTQNKRRENLIAFAEDARLSRELVTLDQYVPVEMQIDELNIETADSEMLLGFLHDMEFESLSRRVIGVEVEELSDERKAELDGGDFPLSGADIHYLASQQGKAA